jgi:hypothetical protein
MKKKLGSLLGTAVVGIGLLLFLGGGVGSTLTTPGHALVYVDTAKKVFYSPPCLRPGDEAALVASRHGPAYKDGYKPDQDCVNDSGFVQDGRSLTGIYLEKFGILGPLKSRWNPDGSWNW